MSTPAAALRPALFLDRDGVINLDHGYVATWARFEMMPGVARTIAAANAAGWAVVVVTNQSGIARGFHTEADVQALHAQLCAELERVGAVIDAVYYCPYLSGAAVAAYDRASEDRKPAPGMILRAASDLTLDLGRSALIGDQDSDMQAARAAGVVGHRFAGGDLWDFAAARLSALAEADQKSGFSCSHAT
jgi:D-glycero-D-manno-heptose 1,7-bisphosphate phosphatase